VLIFLTGNLSFSLKNFDFSRTFLLGLSGISKEILEISALFPGLLHSFFFSGFSCGFFSINLIGTHYQNNLLLLSGFKIFHFISWIDKIKSQAT